MPFLQGGGPGVTSNMQLQLLFRALRAAASAGAAEFRPSPSETRDLIRDSYSAPRTRLCRFREDTIDQTEVVEGLMTAAPHTKGTVSVVDLEGNHLSPVYVKLQARPPFLRAPVSPLFCKAFSPRSLLHRPLASSRFHLLAAPCFPLSPPPPLLPRSFSKASQGFLTRTPPYMLAQPGSIAPQLQLFGMGSEVVIGNEKEVEALAMDIVTFIKGFA